VSHTPEHDKIDALRTANPLATNLAHLLLNGEGWVLENKLVDPPLRVPVTRIAAALLGVDPVAYRKEVTAQLGLTNIPAQIAAIVTDWSGEPFVIDEVRRIDDEAVARTKTVISHIAAESPLAAAVAANHPDLLNDGVVLAAADPSVDEVFRGSLLGAAVSLGLIDNASAYDHPAYGAVIHSRDILGEPEPFGHPSPDDQPQQVPAVAVQVQPAVLPFVDPAAEFEALTPTAADDVLPAPIPEAAFHIGAPSYDEATPDAELSEFDFTQFGAAPLNIPAFESGDMDPTMFAGPPANTFNSPTWNPNESFGPSGFADLGVTPPDDAFQFGSYDINSLDPVEDFNGPVLDPSMYDATASVDGVTEATDDATLQAQSKAALAYLLTQAPAGPAPSAADAFLDLAPVFEDPTFSEQATDVPVLELVPEVTTVHVPMTFNIPADPVTIDPVPPVRFDTAVTPAPAVVPDVDETPVWQNFDLINVPDGPFTPVLAKNAVK